MRPAGGAPAEAEGAEAPKGGADAFFKPEGGGGPAYASQIWIVEIYTLAFRSLRFGLASAFSVILFLFMLSIGYFYVRAMTSGERERGHA